MQPYSTTHTDHFKYVDAVGTPIEPTGSGTTLSTGTETDRYLASYPGMAPHTPTFVSPSDWTKVAGMEPAIPNKTKSGAYLEIMRASMLEGILEGETDEQLATRFAGHYTRLINQIKEEYKDMHNDKK